MATSAKNEPSNAAEAPPPKKKRKLMIILLVLLLLAGGGGAGGWYVFKQKAAAEAEHASAAEEDDDEDEDAAKKAAAKKKKKKKAKGPAHDPLFVTLDPYFTVNLAGEDRDRFLQLGVILEVTDTKAPDALKAKMPVIRSEVLYLLSGKSAKELLSVDGKKKLAGEILEIARAPLAIAPPENGIDNVHFSIFVVQ